MSTQSCEADSQQAEGRDLHSNVLPLQQPARKHMHSQRLCFCLGICLATRLSRWPALDSCRQHHRHWGGGLECPPAFWLSF